MIKGEHNTNWRRLVIGGLLAIVAFTVMMVLPLPLDPVQKKVAAAAVLFGVLWFSEALPLFVTSLLVPVVLAVLTPIPEKELLQPFFDPLIALFLGSFVIAIALEKHRLGERITAVIYKIFGRTPKRFLLGLVMAAAFFGMWLSNTATVAFLLPVVLFVIKENRLGKKHKQYAKALLFAISIGATVGGMGTIVGTPPNAIATRLLADTGQVISFLEWIKFGLIMVVPLVPVTWLSLAALFPVKLKKLKPIKAGSFDRLNLGQIMTLVIMGLTILFWVSSGWHGISAPIIALGAVVALYATRTIGSSDFFKVPFSTLILFGGGLSIAQALFASGLTQSIATGLSRALGPLPVELVLLVLILLAIILTLVSSNTAQAAIMVPIVISLGVSLGVDTKMLVVAMTLGLSIDFMSPLGTPPAAIVYEAGHLRYKDFVRAGIITTLAGASLIYLITLVINNILV